MSDKPLIQQALAADLADLILGINPKSEATGEAAAHERDIAALGYLRGFWECICREWEGIDRLRCAPSLTLAARHELYERGQAKSGAAMKRTKYHEQARHWAEVAEFAELTCQN